MARQVTTIEATGKRWKGLRLLSILGFIIGLCIAFGAGPGHVGQIGVWLAIAGFLGLAIAKAGAWWYHG